jgi:hypothetical protein
MAVAVRGVSISARLNQTSAAINSRDSSESRPGRNPGVFLATALPALRNMIHFLIDQIFADFPKLRFYQYNPNFLVN